MPKRVKGTLVKEDSFKMQNKKSSISHKMGTTFLILTKIQKSHRKKAIIIILNS